MGDRSLDDYKVELVPLEERITRHRALASTLTAVARHLRESAEKLDAVVITGDITYANALDL